MKKISRILTVMISGVLLLTGCSGSTGEGTTKVSSDDVNEFYKITAITYKASDYVDIGDYSSFEVELNEDDYTINDEDVQEYVEDQIDGYTYTVRKDKDVTEEGDTIECDLYFTIDGMDTANYDMIDGTMIIGENFMQIDGFDEQLINVPVGETVEFTMTFPDDYSIANLAGYEADFTVNIYAIVDEYPMTYDDLNDSWVSATLGYDTVDEYLADVKDNLQVDADLIRTNAIQAEVVNQLLSTSTFKGTPEGLKELRIKEYKNYYIYQANQAGETLEDYLADYDLTEDTWNTQLDSYMDNMIQKELILMVIAQEQGADTDTTNYNSYVAGMKDSEDVGDDYFDVVFPDDYCRLLYCEQVALDVLVGNTTVVSAE